MTLPSLLHINISQSDIDSGVQRHPSRCPIWNAVHRTYPEAKIIKVGCFTSLIDGVTYWHGWKSILFIRDFDRLGKEGPCVNPRTVLMSNKKPLGI